MLHAAFFVVSSQCTFFTNTSLIMQFLFLLKVVKSFIMYKQGGIETGFVIWNGACGSNWTLEKKHISHTSISAVEFLVSSELSLKACTCTRKRYASLYFFIMMLSLHIACKNYCKIIYLISFCISLTGEAVVVIAGMCLQHWQLLGVKLPTII